jgi:hypothetical protein
VYIHSTIKICKVELPGKYSYFHEVLKKQALCMHATRFSDFKTTSSVITTYEKGLIIYGLSPTQQQAHKELLRDLISIYGLNRLNSKLTKNSCRIYNNTIMVL